MDENESIMPRYGRDVFLAYAKREFARANAEDMSNPHWEYMVRSAADPYWIREWLGVESIFESRDMDQISGPNGPDWCFKRFGTTRTRLDDGRVICIGGEHEDWYDPNFCIYNDVIVMRPPIGERSATLNAGEVEIYGYPAEVFPPTDFHTATLAGDKIFVIGRLGYRESRTPGVTPVFALDTKTYRISSIKTYGHNPGWIHGHHASYIASTHAIVVRAGKMDVNAEAETNNVVYRLDLETLRWTVLSATDERKWYRLVCVSDYDGKVPPQAAFVPKSVPHQYIAPEDGGTAYTDPPWAIDFEGVRVTFEAFGDEYRVFIEGTLRPEIRDALFCEWLDLLGRTTKAKWQVVESDRKWR